MDEKPSECDLRKQQEAAGVFYLILTTYEQQETQLHDDQGEVAPADDSIVD